MATPRNCTTGFNPTEPVSDARSAGTLQMQDSLPKMPIPPLQDCVDKYLATVLPALSEEDAARTRACAERFMAGDGPYLYSKLLEYDANHINYIEDFYREIYTGAEYSNYSLNPNFILEPNPAYPDAASMASFFINSMLQHHYAIRTGSYPPTVIRGKALCMRQMPWIYGTARIALDGGVDDTRNFIDSSKHIGVLCGGSFYTIRVLDDNFNIIATQEILTQRFNEIASHARTVQSPCNLGILTTTDQRTQWAQARERLFALNETNGPMIDSIDSALFLVALDGVSALSENDMERNMLYGLPQTVCNRWLDKATLVVCEDGVGGLTWEHSMNDGHTMMEMMAEVASGYSCDAPVNGDAQLCALSFLDIKLDEQTASIIPSLAQRSIALAESCGIEMFEYTKFGANFIKSCKCSPDGFAQACQLITFFGMKGRQAMPYESVLAKAFKHGRVTVARNLSQAIADNVTQFVAAQDPAQKAELFCGVVSEVSRICREAAGAKEFDRPFLALRRIAAMEGRRMELCEDPAWAQLNNLDLCTSHCGKKPIRYFGYEAPSADGFSIGYFITSNGIQFAVTHFNQEQATEMKARLQAQLDELFELFTSIQQTSE